LAQAWPQIVQTGFLAARQTQQKGWWPFICLL
jgi:hypothetical protein